MSYKGQKILAVIPARGGSKSIPRKNLCKIGGISLLGRAIRTAKEMTSIDTIIVSTDDDEIIQEALHHGAQVPFKRPAELSSDTAKSTDMWIHAWIESEKQYSMKYDISVLLEPTSPLRCVEDIQRTIDKIVGDKFPAAATISRTPAHFTPNKTLLLNDSKIEFYHQQGSQYSRRQDIPEYYYRNGLCYAVTRKHLIDNRLIIEENCAGVVVERFVVNIDELYELKIAEFLLTNPAKTQS